MNTRPAKGVVGFHPVEEKNCPTLGKGTTLKNSENCPTLGKQVFPGTAPHKSTKGGFPPGCLVRREKKEGLSRKVKSPLSPTSLREKLNEVGSGEVRIDVWESILLFLDFVARKMRKGEIEVSRQMAEAYLSRVRLKEGKSIRLMPLLQLVGVVEKTRRHSTDAHYACRYGFSLSPVLEYPVVLTSAKARKLITHAQKRKEARLAKLVERSWVQKSLEASIMPDDVLDRLGRKRGRSGTGWPHRKTAQSIQRREFNLSAKHGGFHCVYSQIPPDFRQEIWINGEQVSRLDLSASHLHCLCAYMFSLIENSENKNTKPERLAELEKFRKEVLSSGDAYRKILPDERDRKKAKRAVNTFLNKKENRFPREVLVALRHIAPKFAATIAHHKKPIGPALQVLERDLMLRVIRRLWEIGIYVIPVTDEILVPHTFCQDAQRVFSEETYKLSGVVPRISGIRLSG